MAIFLHTRIRVSDLDRSIDWYTEHLGFQLQRRSDKSPAGNHIAMLQLPDNDHLLELTWSADYQLEVPEDLMHLAIGVEDLLGCCARLEGAGIEIWPDGWRQKLVDSKMAFIDDPDGYEIELLERSV